MTVEQLIAALEKMPPGKTVQFCDNEKMNGSLTVESVHLETNFHGEEVVMLGDGL